MSVFFDRLRDHGFDIIVRNHAEAILLSDFRAETTELIDALVDFQLPVTELLGSGGGEAPATQRLRRRLADMGWRKHNFVFETRIDGATRAATSHEIDHVRTASTGTIALEIEWNNKDPFFDRDLENFQRLHAQGVISLGALVTRGAAMQAALTRRIADFLRAGGYTAPDNLLTLGMKRRTERQRTALDRLTARGLPFPEAFSRTFVADKFGTATTHWAKLQERIDRGVGNPCPLILIGLPAASLTD